MSPMEDMPMRLGEPARMQAAINITPLVDVVLVLLIIFMVMAPEMRKGPDVNLPNTAKPVEQGDERGRILVSIDERGGSGSTISMSPPNISAKPSSAAVGCEARPQSRAPGQTQSSTSAKSGRPWSRSTRPVSAAWA